MSQAEASEGIRGPESELQAGATVTVSTKGGAAKTARVGRVIWRGDGKAIASIEAERRSAFSCGRADEDRPVRGCSACRSLGRMCKQCRFDEFDS